MSGQRYLPTVGITPQQQRYVPQDGSTGPSRSGMGFQDGPLTPPPSTQIPGTQDQLKDLVGALPPPVDTSALLAKQAALEASIRAMYAQAMQAQSAGYASQLSMQSRMNALLAQDPTAGTDAQILAALQAQERELNRPRNDRAIWGYGFQRNG